MPHQGVNVNTTPINLDDEYSLSSPQTYSIQCTGPNGYIEEQKNLYEVRILLAAEAPTDLDEAFFNSQVLTPKGSHFTYRPKPGEACYVWCHYGPSRISFVEKGD